MKQQSQAKKGTTDIYAMRRRKKRKRILKRLGWGLLITLGVLVLYLRRDAWLPTLETIGVRHQSQHQNDPEFADGNFPLYIDGSASYQAGSISGNLVLLGDSYLYIFQTSGARTAARQHTYGSAMLRTAGDYALIYEQGGTRFRLETVRKIHFEKSTNDRILFARVSKNGMTALVTASDTCASRLLVFNAKGQQIYQRDCVEELAEITFNSDDSGCYAAAIRVSGGVMQSVIYAYSFSSEEILWTGQPLDILAVSVYNTEGNNLFVLGDTAACYLSSTGVVLSTYVYPDELVSGSCDSSGMAALLLRNTEKRSHSVAILNGSSKEPVLRTYDKEIRSIGMLNGERSVLVQMRSQMLALSAEGTELSRTEIKDGCNSFLRIGNYLFLIGYDQIDRIAYKQ